MGILDELVFVLASRTGGLVGAASAAYLASLRVGSSLEDFRHVIREYLVGKTDETSRLLGASFDEFDASWKSFGLALDRLGKAAKSRK